MSAEAEPRPAFVLLVCGSAGASGELVVRKLDAVTAAKRGSHRVITLVGPGESDAVKGWVEDSSSGYLGFQFEPLLRSLYGRYAHPRWAMTAVGMAHAVVIFGPPGPWWRVARYARDAGVPIRHIHVSAGDRPPVGHPSPPPPRPTIPSASLLDGAGPLGLPH